MPQFIKGEWVMLPVKPVPEAHLADRDTKEIPNSGVQLGSSSSPKMQELRAIYEALYTAKNKNANPGLKK